MRMLDLLASVGVQAFDITHTNRDGIKRGFPGRPKPRGERPLDAVPNPLGAATREQRRRPPAFAPGRCSLVQLDDLKAGPLERIRAFAFVTIETSPGNYQAWIAVEEGTDPDFARRLRKGQGPTQRIRRNAHRRQHQFQTPLRAGFSNRRGDRSAQPGRIATRAELDEAGLVAPAEPVR